MGSQGTIRVTGYNQGHRVQSGSQGTIRVTEYNQGQFSWGMEVEELANILQWGCGMVRILLSDVITMLLKHESTILHVHDVCTLITCYQHCCLLSESTHDWYISLSHHLAWW